MPAASSIVSIMSATSRLISGAPGSGTGSARRNRTRCPMRAIFRMAMALKMRPENGFGEGSYPCYSASPRAGAPAAGAWFTPTGAQQMGAQQTEGEGGQVQVLVRDNNVDQALKALKKKMQREGIFREMKLRRHYEKPSERRAREAAEAVRRARKLERKRLEREGF